jgi:hypothetical protein
MANQSGLALRKHMNHRDYIIVTPDSPTHIPDQQNHLPDVLDIAILNKIYFTYEIDNFTDNISSDHSLVVLTLHGKPSSNSPVMTKSITNWPRFAVDLHCTILSPNPVINSIAKLD